MSNFRIGIDAEAIERTVNQSLRGLQALDKLRDLDLGAWLGKERDVEIDETIEVGAGAELEISTFQGDIEIRGSETDRIRIVADGERVTLGGTTLVAHLTPGHTRGAITWTMEVTDAGRTLAVVFFPSANVNPGVRLVGNARYPEIADDFRRSFAIWRSLPCDVPLGSHGQFYDM